MDTNIKLEKDSEVNEHNSYEIKVEPFEIKNEELENTAAVLIPDRNITGKVRIIKEASNSKSVENESAEGIGSNFNPAPLSRRDVFQHMCNLKIYPNTKARSLL